MAERRGLCENPDCSAILDAGHVDLYDRHACHVKRLCPACAADAIRHHPGQYDPIDGLEAIDPDE